MLYYFFFLTSWFSWKKNFYGEIDGNNKLHFVDLSSILMFEFICSYLMSFPYLYGSLYKKTVDAHQISILHFLLSLV